MQVSHLRAGRHGLLWWVLCRFRLDTLPRSMNFHFEKNWKFKVSRERSSSVVEFNALR